MNAFGNFVRSLRASIGNGLDNDPDDIRKTKDKLNQIGYLGEEPDNGFITRDTDTAIRSFQRDHNLKEDGIMNPGGETERALFQKTAATKAKENHSAMSACMKNLSASAQTNPKSGHPPSHLSARSPRIQMQQDG